MSTIVFNSEVDLYPLFKQLRLSSLCTVQPVSSLLRRGSGETSDRPDLDRLCTGLREREKQKENQEKKADVPPKAIAYHRVHRHSASY
jgi:hypothetical protein